MIAVNPEYVENTHLLPDGDEMAMIIDPEGISFGLFKPKGP
jgi:hypothetical protein